MYPTTLSLSHHPYLFAVCFGFEFQAAQLKNVRLLAAKSQILDASSVLKCTTKEEFSQQPLHFQW